MPGKHGARVRNEGPQTSGTASRPWAEHQWPGIAERFPTSHALGRVEPDVEPSGAPESWPFGLRYTRAVGVPTPARVDISQAGYCPQKQMSVLGTALWIEAATSRDFYCPETTVHDSQRFVDQVVDRSESD